MVDVIEKPSDQKIWEWLAEIPDPEIPVISLVDLGIIRGIAWVGDMLEVTLTPTYSGCPATGVISIEVETALLARGIESVAIKSQISPAWTTDWISSDGRRKLLDYGIVPPVGGTSCAGTLRMGGAQQIHIECPQCGSQATERVSQFGSTPCKASYRCKSCLEPFDYFKSI